jgi:hypothetical protein
LHADTGRESNPEYFSIPGSHLGIYATLLAWRRQLIAENPAIGDALPTEMLEKILLEVCGKRFQGHTDDHGNNQHNFNGCGHLKHCLEDSEGYGLNDDDRKTLSSFLESLGQPNVFKKIYSGVHKEGAVLIINVDKKVCIPHTWGAQKQFSAFVYHKKMVERFFKIIADKLHAETYIILEPPRIIAQKLINIFESQLATTVGHLAKDEDGEPLDVFEITETAEQLIANKIS